MAAPTYSAGTIGNVLNGVSLGPGHNAAALIDLSTKVGGKTYAEMMTGTTAPTAATTFSMRATYAATPTVPNTSLAAAATAGATTLSVGSIAGMAAGQLLALIPSGGPGEVVTVASTSGTTVTIGTATQAAYAVGTAVFLVEASPSGGLLAPGQNWAPNSTYGTSMYPPAAFLWVLHVVNGDTVATVNVSATTDTNPTFA